MNYINNQVEPGIDNDSSVLGIAQWNGLRAIADQYNNKEIINSPNIFGDVEWIIYRGKEHDEVKGNLYWDIDLEVNGALPKVILLKIFAYWNLTVKSVASSTTYAKTMRIRRFLNYMRSKHILIGEEDNTLIGLNAIVTEDIESFIDSLLEEKVYHSTKSFCSDIKEFKISLKEFEGSCPFLQLADIFPWDKAGMKHEEWLKQRAKDLGITFNKPQPYTAFPPETASPLIEISMHILDNYADKAIELFEQGGFVFKDDKRGVRSVGRFTYKQKRKHVKELEGVFDELLPLELENHMEGAKGKAPLMIVRSTFYRDLFRIIQGAMLNIILFTTGLRNFDTRHLKVGDCNKSEHVKNLWYIDADIEKMNNHIHIPVPEQTDRAIKKLEKLRFGECEYLVTNYSSKNQSRGVRSPKKGGGVSNKNAFRSKEEILENYKLSVCGITLNRLLSDFAAHFDIPFNVDGDKEGTCHCYRATTAGWLASASNLSVLLVRRLFGHASDIMPLSYLHHSVYFVEAIEEAKEITVQATANNLANAVSSGKIAGVKGRELQNGYKYEKGKCKSATDKESLMGDFTDQLADFIRDGQMCGFVTPLAVICGRSPNDTTPSPCARLAYKDEIAERGINKELLKHMSLVRPDMCIGNQCQEAIVGEWSTRIRDSFVWYVKYLKGVYGDQFTDTEIEEEARSFIAQYAEDMKTVFGLEEDDV